MASQQPFAIEPEATGDAAAVRDLLRAAFTDEPEVGDLPGLIRRSGEYVAQLALVARTAGAVVGFVMVSGATLVDGERRHAVLTLSPLAVHPDHQRRGMGAALVREALRRAEDTGAPLVLLEGSPAYYPRFGFQDARRHGVAFDLPDWAPPDAGMVYLLPAYDPAVRGHVEYPPAFAAVAGG